MGAFLIAAGLKEVRGAVYEQLDSQGFKPISNAEPRSLALFANKWAKSPRRMVEATISLTPFEGTVLVEASFGCTLLCRVGMLVIPVYMVTFAVFLALCPDEFTIALRNVAAYLGAASIVAALPLPASTQLPAPPKCHLILAGFFVAIILLSMLVSRLETRVLKAMSATEAQYWSSLRKDFRVRLVAPARHRILDGSFTAAYTVALFLACLIITYKLHHSVFLLSFSYLLFGCLYSLIPLLYGNQPGLYPRILTLLAASKTVFVNSLPLLLLAFGFFCTAGNLFGQQAKRGTTLMSFAEVQEFLSSGKPWLDEVYSGQDRFNQLRSQSRQWAERIKQLTPRAEDFGPYIEGVITAIPALMVAAALWFLITVGFKIFGKSFLATPESWRDSIGQQEVTWIRLPAEVECGGLHDLSFRLVVILLFAIGALLNVTALFASVESTSFALTGHTIFFPQIQTALSWVFVPFLAAGRFTRFAEPWLWSALARITLLVIALPSLAVLARRAVGIGYYLAHGVCSDMINIFFRHRISDNATRQINRMCSQLRLVRPKVKITTNRAVHLDVRHALLGRRPTLSISEGASSQLSEAELMAAVTHELGHVRHGMRKFYLLRLLSILGGYPPWFLLLLVDFRGLEEDADRFALSLGADPQALARAIIKTGCIEAENKQSTRCIRWIYGKIPDNVRSFLIRFLKPLVVIDRFLCSCDLVGYLHPLPRDRIAAILADSGAEELQ